MVNGPDVTFDRECKKQKEALKTHINDARISITVASTESETLPVSISSTTTVKNSFLPEIRWFDIYIYMCVCVCVCMPNGQAGYQLWLAVQLTELMCSYSSISHRLFQKTPLLEERGRAAREHRMQRQKAFFFQQNMINFQFQCMKRSDKKHYVVFCTCLSKVHSAVTANGAPCRLCAIKMILNC